MTIETLRSNLVYLKNRHYLSNHKMDKIMGHNSRLFDRISVGKCLPQLQALKMVSDHFKISIDDLVRTDISKHNQHDLFNYYQSAQRSLNYGSGTN